jgi:hypothetical protein
MRKRKSKSSTGETTPWAVMHEVEFYLRGIDPL